MDIYGSLAALTPNPSPKIRRPLSQNPPSAEDGAAGRGELQLQAWERSHNFGYAV